MGERTFASIVALAVGVLAVVALVSVGGATLVEGEASISLGLATDEVNATEGESLAIEFAAEDVPDDVGAYAVEFVVSDANVTNVTAVEASGDPAPVVDDPAVIYESSARIEVAYDDAPLEPDDDGTVELGVVTLDAVGAGNAVIDVELTAIGDGDGRSYSVDAEGATASAAIDVDGDASAPPAPAPAPAPDDEEDDLDPATFEITAVELPPTVNVSSSVPVSVTVANAGDVAGSGTVTAVVGDESGASAHTNATVDGNATETVELDVTSPDEPGTYDVTVIVGDAESVAELGVVDPDRDDEPDRDDGDGVPGFGIAAGLLAVTALLVVFTHRKRNGSG